jgi:hypothetical protein
VISVSQNHWIRPDSPTHSLVSTAPPIESLKASRSRTFGLSNRVCRFGRKAKCWSEGKAFQTGESSSALGSVTSTTRHFASSKVVKSCASKLSAFHHKTLCACSFPSAHNLAMTVLPQPDGPKRTTNLVSLYAVSMAASSCSRGRETACQSCPE